MRTINYNQIFIFIATFIMIIGQENKYKRNIYINIHFIIIRFHLLNLNEELILLFRNFSRKNYLWFNFNNFSINARMNNFLWHFVQKNCANLVLLKMYTFLQSLVDIVDVFSGFVFDYLASNNNTQKILTFNIETNPICKQKGTIFSA